jgi:YkoY family integral membrane protein
MLALMGQTFELQDLALIGLLIVLEGALSVDNALVLGLLAGRLPKHQQQKALTYGLIGAFAFRFIAIAAATFLLKWTIFKLLGGVYLLWVAIKHFCFENNNDTAKKNVRLGPDGHPVVDDITPDATRPAQYARFWPTVLVIEMTDIAFAVDSIVAAMGVVGNVPVDHPASAPHPKLWVVIVGGFIGVVLMRFAAALFIKLLNAFPRFEVSAYLLVTLIGLKLVIDYSAHKLGIHSIDFDSVFNPAFWIFWLGMIACFCIGFIRPVEEDATESHNARLP